MCLKTENTLNINTNGKILKYNMENKVLIIWIYAWCIKKCMQNHKHPHCTSL